MKKDISKFLYVLIMLIAFSCSIAFGQNDFFKYSTFYSSMNMGTSMIEEQDYMAIDRGYEDVTQLNKFDYNFTLGLRKVARYDYQYKVKTWYYGDEKDVSDKVAIGNAKGWEYLANYSFIRNRGEKFTEQNFWLRYVQDLFVHKVQYTDNQRVDLRYASIDSRFRANLGKFDFTIGTCFRIHPAYGIVPIDDFWTSGEQSFPQLAEEFGYSSEFINGDWHWYKGDELLATSSDEFYKHYFGQAISDFNKRELDKLGLQKEVSAVIGVAYYTYNPKFWIHTWLNILPYHYGLDDFSFKYSDGVLNNMDWDSGLILGFRITENLGVFIEGVHQRYWEKEVFDCKFGFNYLFY